MSLSLPSSPRLSSSHQPLTTTTNHYPKPPSSLQLPNQPPPTTTSTTTAHSKKHIKKLQSKLSHLCKSARLAAARRLFDTLLLSNPLPTLLWNTLLIGYVCNSLPLHALRLFSLFNQLTTNTDNVAAADPYTYSSALKACADARLLPLGKSIHAHILRRSPSTPPVAVLNSLLNMYAELSPANTVRQVFDEMPAKNAVSWNTVIAWCVRNWQPREALHHFRRMLRAGVRPTTVSFVNVFPAVAWLGSKKCADQIYGMLVKCGREFTMDVFVVSSAICMYADLSDFASARRVFDLADARNTEVWNAMIGACVQNDCCEEAVSLFIELLEVDGEVSADSVTYLNCLMAVSQMQDVGLGQQLHAYLIKASSNSLPLILSNALIVMYSRCGCIQLAFDLFQCMPERDVVTWNTMITAFVQKELNMEGLLLVREMQKQGLAVDDVTVSALLSAASNLGCLSVGKETYGYLIRHGIECEGMESYLIDMYSKSGRVEIARELFDANGRERRDQVTWNAMIAGYMQNGRTEEALNLFRTMVGEENQTPTPPTLSSVLPACVPVGGVLAGKAIHSFAIRRLLDKNVFVGTALVDMYSRCGEILSAERVFDEMSERNTVTYTTMLSGFGQHGLGGRALSLFRSMQNSGIKPDAVTFVALLSVCSYSGLVDEGLAFYDSMDEYGILSAPEHSCCVIDMLGRAGRVEEAYEFVHCLEEEKLNVKSLGISSRCV